MKKWLLRILAGLSLVAAVAAFLGYLPAWVLGIQPLPTWPFAVVLLLTPFAGRLFCARICPLGILQSIVQFMRHPQTRVRRVCTRLPETRAQRAVRWTLLAAVLVCIALGWGALGYALTPYAILGKALVGFAPGVVLIAVVLVLAAVGRGRIWCNWICPAGTLFNALARVAVRPDKVDAHAGCKNCRACFTAAAPAAEDATPGVSRRDVIAGLGVLAAAETAGKTTDGGYAPVSLPGVPARPAEVLPPGAVDRALFNRLCVGCGACLAACPEKCLVPSTAWRTLGQPKMDFRHSHCLLACPQRCAAACPAGALKVRDFVARRDLHMGHAIWKKDLCLREKEDVACTACVRKCPVGAIALVRGRPFIDKDKCIGCGACEHVCPARPLPAIFVKGFDRQRIVRPFNLADLIDEMRALIVRGTASAVVAHEGVITAQAAGRGVAPLLSLLDAGKLRRGLVVDKVIGRAAAAICIVGRVRKVHGLLVAEDARVLLEEHGIAVSADKTVPKILNRELSASCPLETQVATGGDPAQMVEALRRFVAH